MVIRTGRARYPETNYKTSNHLIAYLDILGASSKICQDKNNEFLNYLNMFMEDALREVRHIACGCNEEFFIKIFSDNILYAVEIKENDSNKENKITKIFNLAANLANETFRYGYLMRGAIVLGQLFHNDKIVYGEGLVRAVNIEEKEAKYPRIIVQDEIATLLNHYCLQDLRDNKKFLNTFLLSSSLDHVSFKHCLLKMLNENKNNERIKEKIMWTIKHFNKCFMHPDARAIDRPQITTEEIESII